MTLGDLARLHGPALPGSLLVLPALTVVVLGVGVAYRDGLAVLSAVAIAA